MGSIIERTSEMLCLDRFIKEYDYLVLVYVYFLHESLKFFTHTQNLILVLVFTVDYLLSILMSIVYILFCRGRVHYLRASSLFLCLPSRLFPSLSGPL